MSEISILFLAPHWRTSLMREFQSSLERNSLKGKLVGADSDPFSSALNDLKINHVISLFTDPLCQSEVLELCKKESIQAIIPFTNKSVEFLDTHRDSFEEEGIHLYIPASATISTCHDKLKLAEFISKAGLLTPTTYSCTKVPEKVSYPLFAKPRKGEGSQDTVLIENSYDLDYNTQKYPYHVFQNFITGKEYTIDWFADREGNPILIVPRERLSVRSGEVAVSRIHMDPKLIEAGREAGTRLGLKGPCNLQGFLQSDGEFIFTDINLRFGSGSVHTIGAGGDIPLLIFKEIAGESLDAVPINIKNGSIMTRFSDGFFIQ